MKILRKQTHPRTIGHPQAIGKANSCTLYLVPPQKGMGESFGQHNRKEISGGLYQSQNGC